MTGAVEFDCTGCGVHVHAFGRSAPPDPLLCASCTALRWTPGPEPRRTAAQRLLDAEAFTVWDQSGQAEAPVIAP